MRNRATSSTSHGTIFALETRYKIAKLDFGGRIEILGALKAYYVT